MIAQVGTFDQYQTVTPVCPRGAAPRPRARAIETRARYGLGALGQLSWAGVARELAGSRELDSLTSALGKLQDKTRGLIETEAGLRTAIDRWNETAKIVPPKYLDKTGGFAYLIFAGGKYRLDENVRKFAASLYALDQTTVALKELGGAFFAAGMMNESNMIEMLRGQVWRVIQQAERDLGPRTGNRFETWLRQARDKFFGGLAAAGVDSRDRLNPGWWDALGAMEQRVTGAKLSGAGGGLGALGIAPAIVALIVSIVKLLILLAIAITVAVGAAAAIDRWTGASRKMAEAAVEHERRQTMIEQERQRRVAAIEANPELTAEQKTAAIEAENRSAESAKRADSERFQKDMQAAEAAARAAAPPIPWYVWAGGGLVLVAFLLPQVLRLLGGPRQ